MKIINVNMAHFKVISVLPLTEQVELRDTTHNKRFYYKCKYASDYERIEELNPGDVVRFNGFRLTKRGAK